MGVLDAFRKTKTDPPPKSVVAAGMPMSGPGVTRINRGRQQSTQEQWQREGWYYFDVIGELRGPLVWIANAVSQAEVYATELDPQTGLPTGTTEDPVAVAAANQVLGGPSNRQRLLRLIALCWQVPGESWIIVRPKGARGNIRQPDEWLVLSGNKVTAKGTSWQYTDPFTGANVTLGTSDWLIRCWQPHPDDQAKADSAVRPALPICREIEKASQNIAARLDSRIATNGVAAIADELDFPRGDYDTSAASFMAQFMSTAEHGLQNPGQASSQVPMMFNAPAEMIASGGAFAHYDLSTQFDGSVVELRQAGIERLASTLDMPKDVADGTQGEANHWSAWQVEESTYKIFIQPLLDAIGDVVTQHWYRAVLIAMGKTPEQADRFALAWDTTAIVARPDDRETLESLYDKILISDEYMLNENGVSDDALPSPEERTRRFLEKAVIGAPTLLADPNVAEALGLTIEIAPVATGVPGEIEGGEVVPQTPAEPSGNALPATQGDEPEPEGVPEGLVAAAELLVFDALSRAGGRLLTRENRGQFTSTPKHELHVSILTHARNPLDLMEGSFTFADRVAETFGLDTNQFGAVLRSYVYNRLAARVAHDRDDLKRALGEAVR